MTPEYATLRRSVVGASEVASVLGLTTMPPAAQVLRYKIDPDYQWSGNAATDMGNALEPGLRDLAAKTLGCVITPAPWVRHPTLAYVGASPDGLCTYAAWRRNLELKVCSMHSPYIAQWGDDGTDEVPHPYWCQTQVQMSCTGLVETDLVALVAGELRMFRIPYDAETAGILCQGANDWYERHVLDGEPLAPDASEAYADLLAFRFPRDNGQVIQGDESAAEAVAAWREHREARLAAEKAEAEAYAVVTTLLGSAATLETSAGVVTYESQATAPRINWRALVASQKIPHDVIDSFTVRGSYRVLRCKGVK